MLKAWMIIVLLSLSAIPLWSQSEPRAVQPPTPLSKPPSASTPLHVSEKNMRHFVLKKVHPVYSQFMLQTRIQGTVVLRVVVDKSGVPSKVSVISGHPVLTPAAIDAAKQWRYKPYLVNGNPVEVETENTFKLVYPASYR